GRAASPGVAFDSQAVHEGDAAGHDRGRFRGTAPLVTAPHLGFAFPVTRKCYGIELDPAYCDVIVRRYTAYAGVLIESFATTCSRGRTPAGNWRPRALDCRSAARVPPCRSAGVRRRHERLAADREATEQPARAGAGHTADACGVVHADQVPGTLQIPLAR